MVRCRALHDSINPSYFVYFVYRDIHVKQAGLRMAPTIPAMPRQAPFRFTAVGLKKSIKAPKGLMSPRHVVLKRS